MGTSIRLIYCAAGNRRNMEIAISLGWHTGARSDDTIYDAHRPLALLDSHWVEPDWARHLAVARAEQPWLAAVPDTMSVADVPRTLAQAEEIASQCAHVLIIPKAEGVIEALPRVIGGRRVVLGYSVPTRYGATPVPAWSFRGWPVHLLGGTPRAQLRLALHLDVVSADGNMAQKIANYGSIFTATGGNVPLRQTQPGVSGDVPYVAVAASLRNLREMWQRAGFTLEPRGERGDVA